MDFPQPFSKDADVDFKNDKSDFEVAFALESHDSSADRSFLTGVHTTLANQHENFKAADGVFPSFSFSNTTSRAMSVHTDVVFESDEEEQQDTLLPTLLQSRPLMSFCDDLAGTVLTQKAKFISNGVEVDFESDESDFEAVFALESDDDSSADRTFLTGVHTTLANQHENFKAAGSDFPSFSFRNVTSRANFHTDVVFESDEEEQQDTLLPALFESRPRMNFCDDLADTALTQKSKCISLETLIPPLGTIIPHSAEDALKQEMIFCAKTTAKSGINASIALYQGAGGSFCKLETTINNADAFGFYRCPFPECKRKSRKKSLLRDHLKKAHHGPFYCMECGINFLQLSSLNRHFRRKGHSRTSDHLTKETIRRHTVAATERFSVCLYEAFSASSDYILS